MADCCIFIPDYYYYFLNEYTKNLWKGFPHNTIFWRGQNRWAERVTFHDRRRKMRTMMKARRRKRKKERGMKCTGGE